jgi:hypothetical protein
MSGWKPCVARVTVSGEPDLFDRPHRPRCDPGRHCGGHRHSGRHFSRPWHGWAVFCIGLVLQQLIHFRHFSRLDRWTRNPVVDPSLEGEGAWDDIFGRLYRHEKDLRSQIEQRDQIITLLRAPPRP